MRSRQSSSLYRAAILSALGAIVTVLAGGCGKPWPAPQAWALRHEGTVHVARLITEHPLYPQYERLGQEIASLQRPCLIPQVPPVFIELGELFLPPPEPPAFPLAEFEGRRSQWQLTLLPDRPAAVTTLDPDLQADLNWARLQAQEQAATQLEQAQSEQESYVAQVRAAAVKARQEAMNNTALDLTISDKDVQAAQDKERERLWAEVEQEVANARATANQRGAQAQQQIEERMRQMVSAAESDVSERMKKRTENLIKSGSEIRSRLSKALTPPEPLAMGSGLTWLPRGESAPARALEPAVAEMLQREQRLRTAQATVLAAKRAEMAADLERGTELAVRRIAGLRGIRVHFPPIEPAAGPDLTEEFRAELRKMFKP